MIHASPFAPVAIPDRSVPALVLEAAARFGGRPALIDAASGRRLAFAELVDQAGRLAAGLARRGVRRGDRLAIVSANAVEYPVAYLGAALAGATVSTLNPLLTEDELAALLTDAGASVVFTDPAAAPKVAAAAARGGARDVVAWTSADGLDPLASLFADRPGPGTPLDPARDLVSLPFSSGTSGVPKGVMLTHRNVVAQMALFDAVLAAPSGIAVLAALPYFHIYGLALIMLLHLWRGNTQVVMSRFDFDTFLGTLTAHRIAWAPLVPPIMLGLAKHPAVDRCDLSALEFVMSGAAPLPLEVERAVARRLGCVVAQGYGMTELAGASHVVPRDPARLRPGSVGLTLPNLEARLVDPGSGDDQATGEAGELWIRGPIVMEGYLHQPEATAATLVEGGWLRTGDIARADADGYFYVVDRVKELIKYNAYQVAPAPLEALLVSHPAIADAAVIPSPDPEAGEVPKAFVVLRAPLTPDAILAFVAERVAPYERIRRVEICGEIPKSPSGKILRRLLVEQERSAASPPTTGTGIPRP